MDYLVHHLLRSSAERLADKEALVCGKTRLSYGQAWQKVSSLASGLSRLGASRGCRVGVYMEPSVEQALSILAISRAGGVFVPINELLFPEQVSHIANDCGMKGLITSRSKLERVKEAAATMAELDFVVRDRYGGQPRSVPAPRSVSRISRTIETVLNRPSSRLETISPLSSILRAPPAKLRESC